jgi:hypothetical protein
MKTPIVDYRTIPEGSIWCIGQHTGEQRRQLERAAVRGALIKVRAYWGNGMGPLKTVFVPVGGNAA